jgi:hypothetical protein
MRGVDKILQRRAIDRAVGPYFDMPHGLAGAFQQAVRIGEFSAAEESDVDVILERSDIRERRIRDARSRMAVMQQLAHVVAALTHLPEPFPRNRAQLDGTIIHPAVDSRIALCASGYPEDFFATDHAAKVERNAARFARVHGRGA